MLYIIDLKRFFKYKRSCLVSNQAGLTMVELVSGIVLMAVLMVIAAMPRETDHALANLDNAASMLKEDLGFARQLAMSTGRNHGVYFNRDGNGKIDYDVYDTATAYSYGGAGNTYAKNPLTRQNFTQKKLEDTHFGLTGNASLKVEFDVTGNPVIGSGGTLRLTSYRGDIYDIYITPSTGLVQINVIST